MIELPFEMTFDLDFTEKALSTETKDKLIDLISNISSELKVNIFFSNADKTLYNFYSEIKYKFNVEITAINPVINNLLIQLMEQKIINVKITENNPDYDKLNNYKYNLTLFINENSYAQIKQINSNNINKIICLHNSDISYDTYKKQKELIINNKEIRKKFYLLPYLEEIEEKKYYESDEKIRPFLTCSSLWFNPIIDGSGRIINPCYHSKKTINEDDFFVLWDNAELNNLRNKLVNIKQFDSCKYCPKFYEDNFLVVEDGVLEYNNKKFDFGNILNSVKSAPTIGIIEDEDEYIPIALYSQNDILDLYNKKKVVFILK